MVSQGNVKNMVQTLAVLAGTEKRRAGALLQGGDTVTQPGVCGAQPVRSPFLSQQSGG